MRKKILGILVLTLVWILWYVPNSYASSVTLPNWKKDNKGWKLVYPDGMIYKNAWYYDITTGIWYYIKEDGYMLSSGKTSEGYSVSASGRLIDVNQLMGNWYTNGRVAEYSNNVFGFKVRYPGDFETKTFGIQKTGDAGDTSIEGGIKIRFDGYYALDIYGSVYVPNIPAHDNAEEFITYSGIRGKIYTQNVNGRIYLNLLMKDSGFHIQANIPSGIPQIEYNKNKTKIYQILKEISITE